MKLNQEEELRLRILEKSLELFKKHGINYVTMDLIAKKLGVSKKTLYVHFSSKKDLLLNCLQNYKKANKKKHTRMVKEAPNVLEGMILIVKQLTKELNQTNPLMFEELERYYPEISKFLLESHWVDDYNDMANLIEEGKSEDLISRDINTDVAAKLFLLQMQHTSNREVFPIDEYPRSMLFRHIFITFMRGMVTKTGMEILDELEY